MGIGNGLPLGAVVTTPEIASVLAQKIQFNTFDGNPVCSAGGLALLKVIDKEKRQSHCADVGSHLLERLRSLKEKHEKHKLNIVEGKMQYLFDENGRRYLGAFAGIGTVSCGHCHPDVLDAITEQSKLLQHATTI
ncbi:hypothetical protein RIF29_38551 [Crotalaria pallida]|uniref:alanine--glyoxylate transaminase n=1 Tax=Crotalaria pallida TaxID=3830 RepID=A0AAN9E059_CROPI